MPLTIQPFLTIDIKIKKENGFSFKIWMHLQIYNYANYVFILDLKKTLPVSGISQSWKESKYSVVHGHVVPTVCFCFSYDSKTTK